MGALERIASDQKLRDYVSQKAFRLLVKRAATDETIKKFLQSEEPGVREAAFSSLVERQHRPTIERALTGLIEDPQKLRAAEGIGPSDTPIDWIEKIRSDFAWKKLKTLRELALSNALANVTSVITQTMARIDRRKLAKVVKQQIRYAPESGRLNQVSLAIRYEREARIITAQAASFDEVIAKLNAPRQ
jgi:hypothetical protein